MKVKAQPFSPLFIGAMVATFILMIRSTIVTSFQSPFHRGNGCYSNAVTNAKIADDFQSPFHRGNGCYYA